MAFSQLISSQSCRGCSKGRLRAGSPLEAGPHGPVSGNCPRTSRSGRLAAFACGCGARRRRRR
eukprot:6203790-Pleurochrysis_carterae.AAC.1